MDVCMYVHYQEYKRVALEVMTTMKTQPTTPAQSPLPLSPKPWICKKLRLRQPSEITENWRFIHKYKQQSSYISLHVRTGQEAESDAGGSPDNLLEIYWYLTREERMRRYNCRKWVGVKERSIMIVNDTWQQSRTTLTIYICCLMLSLGLTTWRQK